MEKSKCTVSQFISGHVIVPAAEEERGEREIPSGPSSVVPALICNSLTRLKGLIHSESTT